MPRKIKKRNKIWEKNADEKYKYIFAVDFVFSNKAFIAIIVYLN